MRAFNLAAGSPWAILPEKLELILEVAARTREERAELDLEAVAAKLGRPLDNTRSVTVRDGVAVIPVEGPIFGKANLFTRISGATSIQELATDLRTALDSVSIRAILLDIDSPGGEVAGTAELAQMIRQCAERKPTLAYVSDYGCSAAYWLASAAGEVVLASTAQVGSIGVVGAYRTGKDSNRVELVSSQSPNKRPDPATESGKAQLQTLIDDIAGVFVADVAGYRGVSEEKVLADFGAGGCFIGASAVEAGLADGVGTFEECLARLARTTSPMLPNLGERGTIRNAEIELPSTAAADTVAEATEADSGPDTGAVVPLEDQSMADDSTNGATTAEQAPAITAAQIEEMQARLQAIEDENIALRAAQDRREVEAALAAVKPGKHLVYNPQGRAALADAVLALPKAHREPVLQAFAGLAVIDTSERGFTAAEAEGGDDLKLTAAEEQRAEALAKRNNLKVEEVKAQMVEAKRMRSGK